MTDDIVKKTVVNVDTPSYSYSNMMKTLDMNNVHSSQEDSPLQVPSRDEIENDDSTVGEAVEIERTTGEEEDVQELGVGSPAEDGPITIEKLRKQIDELFR